MHSFIRAVLLLRGKQGDREACVLHSECACNVWISRFTSHAYIYVYIYVYVVQCIFIYIPVYICVSVCVCAEKGGGYYTSCPWVGMVNRGDALLWVFTPTTARVVQADVATRRLKQQPTPICATCCCFSPIASHNTSTLATMDAQAQLQKYLPLLWEGNLMACTGSHTRTRACSADKLANTKEVEREAHQLRKAAAQEDKMRRKQVRMRPAAHHATRAQPRGQGDGSQAQPCMSSYVPAWFYPPELRRRRTRLPRKRRCGT